MKTVRQQVHTMRLRWRDFEVVHETADSVTWLGSLASVERTYRIMIDYGLPKNPESDELYRRLPLVRVLSPQLEPRFEALEEAPLPHVYFIDADLTLSPLCLFDVEAGEWGHDDFVALTTIPWTADWLACYEGWLATGRWFGGGRHLGTALGKSQ
jgi:hypothetical protein